MVSGWEKLSLPPAILQLLEQFLHNLLKGLRQGLHLLIWKEAKPQHSPIVEQREMEGHTPIFSL